MPPVVKSCSRKATRTGRSDKGMEGHVFHLAPVSEVVESESGVHIDVAEAGGQEHLADAHDAGAPDRSALVRGVERNRPLAHAGKIIAQTGGRRQGADA